MADQTAKCQRCEVTFAIRLLRFVKVDGAFQYLCKPCRDSVRPVSANA